MKSLDVLQRLAGQAVDRERRTLSTIAAKIADVESQIDATLQAVEHEASASLDFMTSGATLTAFIEASNRRAHELRGQLLALQDAFDAQAERVRLERVEQKRYERLIERRAQETARETAAKEQKTIDELVAMRRKTD